jgi:hypothetical protein
LIPGRNREGIFLFATMSKPSLGSTQPSIEGVPGALSLRVKWLGHEADQSFSSSAETKNAWSSLTPPIHTSSWYDTSLAWAQLYLYLFLRNSSLYKKLVPDKNVTKLYSICLKHFLIW